MMTSNMAIQPTHKSRRDFWSADLFVIVAMSKAMKHTSKGARKLRCLLAVLLAMMLMINEAESGSP
jgi:hypothetical protein